MERPKSEKSLNSILFQINYAFEFSRIINAYYKTAQYKKEINGNVAIPDKRTGKPRGVNYGMQQNNSAGHYTTKSI